MVHVILSVQLHTVMPYGYSPDDKGLKSFLEVCIATDRKSVV